MNRRALREIFQNVSFVYFSFEDGKFRRFNATDIIKGAIIEALSADSNGMIFEDLIYPYPLERVETILQKAGQGNILTHGREEIEIKPCDEKITFTKEYVGTVTSISGWHEPHDVTILDACNPYKVEVECGCKKITKNRKVSSIWSPIILAEWNLPSDRKIKFYARSVDFHTAVIDFRLRREYDIRCLGIDDGLDYIKPYLFALLDVWEALTNVKDYELDFAFLYYSPMFNQFKKEINKYRATREMEPLKMYNSQDTIDYLLEKYSFPPPSIYEIIDIMGFH